MVSVSLRALTLASKFLLVFLLAKLLVPADVGIYGLLAAVVGYGLYAAGFEFYTYSLRELIEAPSGRRLAIVRDQSVFHALVYAVALPAMVAACAVGWIPWTYGSWLIGLLLLEHAAQEMNRVLVAISRPVLASVVLFLRSGAWCLVVVLVMGLWPPARSLTFVLVAWLVGVALACALAASQLLRLDRDGLRSPVNWCWIRRGVHVAVPMLVASLAMRGLFTFDRFWIEAAAGLSVVGAYVLFAGMATAVLSFIDAGVIDFMYPRIVAAAQRPAPDEFESLMAALLKRVALAAGVLAVACWAVSGPLIDWIGQTVYAQHRGLLPPLLLAIVLQALSTVPHVGLYARRCDRAIVGAQVAAFAVFMGCAAYGIRAHGGAAVPWALCAASLTLLAWKSIAHVRQERLARPSIVLT